MNGGGFCDVDWKIFSFDFDKRTLIGSNVVWDDTERGLSRSCCGFTWIGRLRNSASGVPVLFATGSTTGLSTTTCGISLGSADARSGTPGIAIRLNNMDVVYEPKHIV
jgi:hypothetical protein